MKTIYKTVTEETIKTISQYKAYDGKMFDNPKECWDYEAKYRAKVNNLFNGIICLEATAEETGVSFDDEEVCYFILPQNKKDVMILDVIRRWHDSDVPEFTVHDIGKLVCICVTDIRDEGILGADYIDIYRWDMYVKSRIDKYRELESLAIRNQILINAGKLERK